MSLQFVPGDLVVLKNLDDKSLNGKEVDHAKHGALWNAGYAYDHCPLCTSPLIDPTDANVFAKKAQKIVQIVRE